jgi:tetratricopeptide (TPR) repeat protein
LSLREKRGLECADHGGMSNALTAAMLPRSLLLGSCFGLLAAACAASLAPTGNTGGVTNLQASDRNGSPSEAPAASASSSATDPRTTEAAEALAAGDYARALALTESSSNAPTGAWLDYDRASALAALGRTDEAVEAFRRASLRFEEAGDVTGRADSLWGRARALDEAHRCAEARTAYEDYEEFVRLRDPRGAEMAAARAGSCKPLVVLH